MRKNEKSGLLERDYHYMVEAAKKDPDDVLDYSAIENEALKAHIDQFGVVIYRKNAEHPEEFFSAGFVREKEI